MSAVAASVQPTLSDLSARLGVSIYTVSRALSGKSGVSKETRDRIVSMAKEIGYVPNAVAATLKGQRSSAIGVMTASGRNQYYSMLIQAIDAVLQKNGLHAVTNDAMRGRRYDQALQRQSVEALLQQRVAAIVTTYPLSRDSLGIIDRWNIPLLFVDALPPRGKNTYPSVGCDNRAASKLVAQYFRDLGYRQVALLAYPKEWNTRAPREQGFLDGAHEFGIAVDVVEADNSPEAAFEAATAYLQRPRRPDAIYALNTPMLQGALRAAREAGLRVPVDISLLGFDDFDWAEFVDPPITVIDQHIDEIGRIAGELVVETLNGRGKSHGQETSAKPRHVAIEPTLVVRRSCRAAHGKPAHDS